MERKVSIDTLGQNEYCGETPLPGAIFCSLHRIGQATGIEASPATGPAILAKANEPLYVSFASQRLDRKSKKRAKA